MSHIKYHVIFCMGLSVVLSGSGPGHYVTTNNTNKDYIRAWLVLRFTGVPRPLPSWVCTTMSCVTCMKHSQSVQSWSFVVSMCHVSCIHHPNQYDLYASQSPVTRLSVASAPLGHACGLPLQGLGVAVPET